VVATAAGVGLIWRQADEAQRARWSASARRPLLGEGSRAVALVRLGVGAGLVAAGVGGALVASDGLRAARNGGLAVGGDVVGVGDCPLNARLEAVVAAAREAMVNAAKFAGVDKVQVFVEVEGPRVTVFVRDRGAGFVPEDVGEDRRGVSESIVGRMTRNG